MANAIFVFCKGLFSETVPRLFKKLFCHKEKPAVVVTIGNNNRGVTFVFNGPVTFTQPPAAPPSELQQPRQDLLSHPPDALP